MNNYCKALWPQRLSSKPTALLNHTLLDFCLHLFVGERHNRQMMVQLQTTSKQHQNHTKHRCGERIGEHSASNKNEPTPKNQKKKIQRTDLVPNFEPRTVREGPPRTMENARLIPTTGRSTVGIGAHVPAAREFVQSFGVVVTVHIEHVLITNLETHHRNNF